MVGEPPHTWLEDKSLQCITGDTLCCMAEVSVRDLRNKGGEILKQVESGRSFVVTRDGKQVAELKPLDRQPLSRDALIERFKHVPLVEAKRLRQDIDTFIDQTI